MAYLYKENGEIEEIAPKNGTDFKLEELQGYVDGYIDIIRLNPCMIMVVNDEGKFTKERNNKATDLANLYGSIFPNDYISGDVVVCQSEEIL